MGCLAPAAGRVLPFVACLWPSFALLTHACLCARVAACTVVCALHGHVPPNVILPWWHDVILCRMLRLVAETIVAAAAQLQASVRTQQRFKQYLSHEHRWFCWFVC
jgi:hypothetical protein